MQGYSSRLAALDYSVCLYSEVFVTTQGGNFPHFMVGHRRFVYRGHAKTIKPNKAKLAVLFQDANLRCNLPSLPLIHLSFVSVLHTNDCRCHCSKPIWQTIKILPVQFNRYLNSPQDFVKLGSWKAFGEEMTAVLYESERKGMMLRKSSQSIYSFPLPDCTCIQDQTNSTLS